jgi:hypothetical protein
MKGPTTLTAVPKELPETEAVSTLHKGYQNRRKKRHMLRSKEEQRERVAERIHTRLIPEPIPELAHSRALSSAFKGQKKKKGLKYPRWGSNPRSWRYSQ